MCTVKKPKEVKPTVEKDPQYLRNPWLDGMSMNRSTTIGRNSLRLDPGSSYRTPLPTLPPPTGPTTPPVTPPTGGPVGTGDEPTFGGRRPGRLVMGAMAAIRNK
jgi:hypothetical protein